MVPLLGVTHSSDYHIWQRNLFASNGVREFSEKGEAWTLIKEVEAAGERIQSVYGLFSTPAVHGGTGQMTSEFEVFSRHSYVSSSTFERHRWVSMMVHLFRRNTFEIKPFKKQFKPLN